MRREPAWPLEKVMILLESEQYNNETLRYTTFSRRPYSRPPYRVETGIQTWELWTGQVLPGWLTPEKDICSPSGFYLQK